MFAGRRSLGLMRASYRGRLLKLLSPFVYDPVFGAPPCPTCIVLLMYSVLRTPYTGHGY